MYVLSIAGPDDHLMYQFKTSQELHAYLHEYVKDSWRWIFYEEPPWMPAPLLVKRYFQLSEETFHILKVTFEDEGE